MSFLTSSEAGDYRRGIFPGVLNLASFESKDNTLDFELLCSDNKILAVGKIKHLQWDSNFFKTPAGRIESLFFQSNSTSPYTDRLQMVKKLIASATQQGLSFLNCRISAQDSLLAHALEEEGFRLCDILNIYLTNLDNKTSEGSCERQEALDILEKCMSNMNFGRIHQDPKISPSLSTKFYIDTTAWILSKNSHLTIAKHNNKPAGFAIGLEDREMSLATNSRYGFLWLIAILPEYRGCGIGGKLLKKFTERFSTSCNYLEIGTQVSNLAANRLYQRAGYQLTTQALTFHRWS